MNHIALIGTSPFFIDESRLFRSDSELWASQSFKTTYSSVATGPQIRVSKTVFNSPIFIEHYKNCLLKNIKFYNFFKTIGECVHFL